MNDIIIQKQAPKLTFDQAKQAWINALLAKVSYAPIYKKIAEMKEKTYSGSDEYKAAVKDAFENALADKEEANLTNDEIQYIADNYTLIDATGSILGGFQAAVLLHNESRQHSLNITGTNDYFLDMVNDLGIAIGTTEDTPHMKGLAHPLSPLTHALQTITSNY